MKKKEILFVCVHNAGRSQMAAAFMEHHGKETVTVRSAGSAPADQIHPIVQIVMEERGINLDRNRATPKMLSENMVVASDYVITMGCGDTCPIFPGREYLDWELDDPKGKNLEQVREIRDQIETKVVELLKTITEET